MFEFSVVNRKVDGIIYLVSSVSWFCTESNDFFITLSFVRCSSALRSVYYNFEIGRMILVQGHLTDGVCFDCLPCHYIRVSSIMVRSRG